MQAETKPAVRPLLLAKLKAVFTHSGFDGATLTTLAQQADLSKASLYHHFPGGKHEMAEVLTRQAVAELQQLGFRTFTDDLAPHYQLMNFVDGFADYVEQGGGSCLLMVFIHNGSTRASLGQLISEQYRTWATQLADAYLALGVKPKAARRQADDLLSRLYGHLITAQLTANPGHFGKAAKRIRKDLERSFG